MAEKPLIVRCYDKMVFEVDRKTLEAKTCSYWDPYCYLRPKRDVDYIEHSKWTQQKQDIYYKSLIPKR